MLFTLVFRHSAPVLQPPFHICARSLLHPAEEEIMCARGVRAPFPALCSHH